MTDLSELNGTRWAGSCELWLDPLGDQASESECTIAIDGQTLSYTWKHEGKRHAGSITVGADGAEFTDSWHQPEAMKCQHVAGAKGLFQVRGEYGPEADWGWRIAATLRTPTGELIVQMTNIAPWGEEARAVRMTCARTSNA
jgi:hypothetical protein